MKLFAALSIIVFFASSQICFSQSVPTGKINYKILTEQVKNLSGGPVKAARVDSLTFEKHRAIFNLSGGTVFQCPLIDKSVHALLYIGDGWFRLTPPDESEQMQIQRFMNKKSMDEKTEFIFFLFIDETFSKLFAGLNFVDTEPGREYKSIAEKSIKFLLDKDGEYLKERFVSTFLDNQPGFFFSYFNDNENDEMFYMIDPAEDENIFLMKRYPQVFTNEFEVICQYPSYKEWKPAASNGTVNIARYDIKTTIENNVDFSAEAGLKFFPLFDKQKTILLYLYSELEVDSILWENGSRAEYYKEEESSALWVMPAEELNTNREYSLKVFYKGDLLEKNELGWISVKSSSLWYPRTLDRHVKSIFDLTFYFPEKYLLCSIGNKLSEESDEEVVTSHWVTSVPVRNASFNLGNYEEYVVEEENLPAVVVYFTEYGHNQIARILSEEGISSMGNMEEKLAEDAINAFRLFKHVYGEIPMKEIYITETPYAHGLAFPGLVHLSWTAFQGMHDEGFVESFIAHEVAHQWWGIQVDFDTYHDQWLSEGFAEYSGLWYMQLVKKNDLFFETLDDWKEDIFSNRKYLFGSGQQAGPISLGYRTNSSGTEGDYDLIIYKKGAWILHMLRNMLLDLNTMREDKFEKMMQDFFASFSGKHASTKDFANLVSRHFGQDMSWFFNQWVYDTSFPDYNVSYETIAAADGKYKTTLKIKASEVPASFKMPVIILLKFDDDKYARLRLEVKGAEAIIELPLLPMEPKEIIFNDLHSVLCNVEYD